MFVSSAHAASTTAQTETPAHADTAATGGASDAHATATHSETGVAHKGVFPPFDSSHFASQLLWLALTFAFFYLFLSRVVLPRIGGIIETRRDRIATDLDQAARMKQESDEALAAYEQELAEAKKKAGSIAQTARDESKAKADAETAEISAALEKKLAEAEASIASIKDKAMAGVGAIAEETAAEIVKKIIGGTVDTASVSAAVKAVRG
ncbi:MULTISPECIES: F0F1 ATP synthase subunit B [Phyllobacterium]|jgi:F-type H+-transporting ATPase subunit b|uniref:F0F1 ATP synthase subunit B n=2 Tax=Pseudomonadota TaxID=1224 RepID=UPI001AD3BA10|nr:F0F1 ATP synthase subunit B [Phyllobacterium calauticae]MBN9138590.1 F0F1 ATP synthase subunit B [Phyllobacterium sp.]MBQ9353817.1 F0F1 ATP synthase subunit B [Phyllobacterium sp.]MBZ3691467.1 F0F1 ATP synthase subunit B [Phyllobacterium calauticae]